jgi:hypothetical protein
VVASVAEGVMSVFGVTADKGGFRLGMGCLLMT